MNNSSTKSKLTPRTLSILERVILVFILLNAVVIFLQESGMEYKWLYIIDLICTIVFTVEMIVKQWAFGFKEYWKHGWNIMDGTLVILSLPSLIQVFVPAAMLDLSVLMALRLLRILRFMRVMHFFPNFSTIMHNFSMALKNSASVLVSFLILIIVVALISCSLFKGICPEYFDTPLNAIYSTFRMCTGEGWNEIPDTIAAAAQSASMIHWVRVYFCIVLVLCSIIGLSLVNSIFVDAMVSDNNDEVLEKLKQMEEKIDKLTDK